MRPSYALPKCELSAAQRQEIIGMEFKKSAREVAILFAVNPGYVRNIWWQAHREVEIRRHIAINPYTSSRLTARVVAEEIEKEPVVIGGVDLIDLHDRHCRWPIGVNRDGERRFCGHQRALSASNLTRSYCAEHAKLALLDHKSPPLLPEIELRIAARYSDQDQGIRKRLDSGTNPLEPYRFFDLVAQITLTSATHRGGRRKIGGINDES